MNEMNKLTGEKTAAGAPANRGVFVPEHWVPAPSTISPQAQAMLANPTDFSPLPQPAAADIEGWRAFIAAADATIATWSAAAAAAYPCGVATHPVGEVTVYELTPPAQTAETAKCAIYYVHGGGFIMGSGLPGAQMAQPIACVTGLTTLSTDYRMPPDHPYPAALDDVLAGYRWALERFAAKDIVVMGSSAGGGLAASLILKLRDLGLPLPAACVLATPEVDLTETGDSFETNALVDVVLQRRLTGFISLYANGHDLRDPYLSPVLADFTKGFVPTLLTTGTRDLFLSNTARFHRALRKAGIEADLHVWEAMPHGGFGGAPEDVELLEETAAFIRKHLRG